MKVKTRILFLLCLLALHTPLMAQSAVSDNGNLKMTYSNINTRELAEHDGQQGYFWYYTIHDPDGVLNDSYNSIDLAFTFDLAVVDKTFFRKSFTYTPNKTNKIFIPKSLIDEQVKKECEWYSSIQKLKLAFKLTLKGKVNGKQNNWVWRSKTVVGQGRSSYIDLLHYWNAKLELLEKYTPDYSHMNAPYREEMQKKYPTEDLSSPEEGGFLLNVTFNNKIQTENDFQVRLCFWHGTKRETPLKFYAYTDKNDKKGHPVVLGTNVWAENWDTEIAPHVKEVNYIERNRNNLDDSVMFAPESIAYLTDYDYDKAGRGENDTICADIRIYSEGELIDISTYYYYWVRCAPEKDTTCHHNECDSTETIVSREQLSATEVLVKYNLLLVCKKCHEKIVMNGLSRVEMEEPTEYCPPHCVERIGHVLFDKITEKNAGNCKQQIVPYEITLKCIRCGWEQTEGIDYDFELLCPCREEDRVMKTEKTKKGDCVGLVRHINTYKVCPEEGDVLIDQRTDTTWTCTPCTHPGMKMVEKIEQGISKRTRFYHIANVLYRYQCPQCGFEEYRQGKEEHTHDSEKIYKACRRIGPWYVELKGEKIKMHLAVNPKDSTAVYVAETEVTQGLWASVYPGNRPGWERGSKYPATGISYEDAKGFISVLNHEAEAKNIPLHFRLPTVDEWLYAYQFGGYPKEGWNERFVHKVAERAHDQMGLYDMKGNVAEMCDSATTIYIDENEKETWTAVAGNSYQYEGNPTEVHWYNLSEGMENVGLRLFADIVPSNEDEPESEAKPEQETENKFGELAVQAGFRWAIQNVYQCKQCGIIYGGYLRKERWHGYDAPIGCTEVNKNIP